MLSMDSYISIEDSHVDVLHEITVRLNAADEFHRVLDRVVEFAWRLPLKFKLRRGKTKWILRQLLYRYVPAALVERPKMGFSVPIDLWLRGPLRDWAEALLSADSLGRHGLFAVRPIRQKWEEHLSGSRNWQLMLWTVLMFQAWISDAKRPTGLIADAHAQILPDATRLSP